MFPYRSQRAPAPTPIRVRENHGPNRPRSLCVTVWGRMVRRTLFVLGAVIGAIFAFAGLIFVAIRTKSPQLLDAVRWFNRTFTNRLQRPFAGKPGAYASVIRHQGRRSGRAYETPIVPFATDDGFVVSLPYGPTADWVKNVLALGSTVLIHEGRTLTLDRPEVVPVAQVEDLFPASEQRTHRLFRIEHCLRLRCVDVDEVDDPASDGDERS
jgi:hypothetical protein